MQKCTRPSSRLTSHQPKTPESCADRMYLLPGLDAPVWPSGVYCCLFPFGLFYQWPFACLYLCLRTNGLIHQKQHNSHYFPRTHLLCRAIYLIAMRRIKGKKVILSVVRYLTINHSKCLSILIIKRGKSPEIVFDIPSAYLGRKKTFRIQSLLVFDEKWVWITKSSFGATDVKQVSSLDVAHAKFKCQIARASES